MYTKIYWEDIQLISACIEENIASLKEIEKEILRLEMHGDDLELCHSIFKNIHRMKNEFSFLGVNQITQIAYAIEESLNKIKKIRFLSQQHLLIIYF